MSLASTSLQNLVRYDRCRLFVIAKKIRCVDMGRRTL